MAVQSLQQAFPQFTDIDGQPLESGYVYVGTAGLQASTNQITVYWDEAKTSPATQPIRTQGGYLMNSGSPGNIYVDADDYSIEVNNKNNSSIYSSTNITNGVKLGLTGAVSRTANSKLSDFVSVKDFGAVGDGTTDDTAAFKAAIDSSNGVYVPAGTFRIAGNLIINSSTTIFGDGMYSTTILVEDDDAFDVRASNVSIRDMYIEGYTDLSTTQKLITIDNKGGAAGQLFVDNVRFRYGLHHIYCNSDPLVHYRIRNCLFFQSRGYSRYYNCSVPDYAEEGTYTSTGCLRGVFMGNQSQDVKFVDCVWEDVTETVIRIDTSKAPGSSFVSSVLIESCFFENNSKNSSFPIIDIEGIGASRVRTVRIASNYFLQQSGFDASQFIRIASDGTATMRDNVIECNHFNNTSGSTIPVINDSTGLSTYSYQNNYLLSGCTEPASILSHQPLPVTNANGAGTIIGDGSCIQRLKITCEYDGSATNRLRPPAGVDLPIELADTTNVAISYSFVPGSLTGAVAYLDLGAIESVLTTTTLRPSVYRQGASSNWSSGDAVDVWVTIYGDFT